MDQVTLEDVEGAVLRGEAALVPETAGYLALAVGEALLERRTTRGSTEVCLSLEGAVLLSPLPPLPGAQGAILGHEIRALLALLVRGAKGAAPGLAAAALPRPADDARAALDDIEAALIPLNRAAARRALARLAREVAREAGRERARSVGRSTPASALSSPPGAGPRAASPWPPSPLPPAAPEAPEESAPEPTPTETDASPFRVVAHDAVPVLGEPIEHASEHPRQRPSDELPEAPTDDEPEATRLEVETAFFAEPAEDRPEGADLEALVGAFTEPASEPPPSAASPPVRGLADQEETRAFATLERAATPCVPAATARVLSREAEDAHTAETAVPEAAVQAIETPRPDVASPRPISPLERALAAARRQGDPLCVEAHPRQGAETDRADALLARFGDGAEDDSLRLARSSLRGLIGLELSPTPPPALPPTGGGQALPIRLPAPGLRAAPAGLDADVPGDGAARPQRGRRALAVGLTLLGLAAGLGLVLRHVAAAEPAPLPPPSAAAHD